MSGNIFEKDLSELSDADFAVLDDHLNTHTIREQSVVKGRVLAIDNDRVLVDINYKAEGSIPLSEFRGEDGQINVEVGQEVEVYLEYVNQDAGCAELSKERADQEKAWIDIAKKFENNELIRGTVTHKVKGGLSVDIFNVKAFLPGSQVSLRTPKNLDQMVGRDFDFKIIKLNQKRGNIVLSRRAILEEKRKVEREETLSKLEVGNVMVGKVKNITDYGVFIDLGGIDGLLHITDITYARITHPSDVISKDDEIEVKILKYDATSQKVSLGRKQIHPDPWEEVQTKYPVGCTVRGKVVNKEKYGVFVELETGIEGLIHSSEMSWGHRNKDKDNELNIGDEVQAMVKGIETQERRISLSIKELSENPWVDLDQRFPVGSLVTGNVRAIVEYGIFVSVLPNIDGLVHISDVSWSKRDKKPLANFKKGDVVRARVKDVDVDSERFSLSIKDVTEDPWLSVQSRYFLGQIVSGKVASYTEYGVFVEIEDGVDGLIHTTELINETDVKDNYPAGKEIKVEILRIDASDRRISLSEKGANAQGGNSSNFTVQASTKGGSKNLDEFLNTTK